MIGLYPADVVRRAEESLMARVAVGSLMQLAARGLATRILHLAADIRGAVVGTRVVLLVGSGNNGGDALFAGAHLRRRGMAVTAVPLFDTWSVDGMRALLASGGSLASIEDLDGLLADADVVVDGIVGIGARGALRPIAADVVDKANVVDALRVAVDIPSGVGVDDGSIEASAFEADVTVTFGCYKPGLFLDPGRRSAGAIHLVDIGLEDDLPDPSTCMLELFDVAELVTGPATDDHKYRRGVVGIAAGGPSYPGAALLTVGAAQYAGVGMVRYLDRGDGVAVRVVDAFPDVVADSRDARSDERVRAWGCGPGFGGLAKDGADGQTVAMMLSEPTPIVLDAGALQCLAESEELRGQLRARADRGLVSVLTPHEGEFRRLFDRAQSVTEIAATWGVIVVRKGPATTITGPDGTVFVDAMGTSDLAVAGSGDVLTGLMAGLLAANPHDDPQEVAAGAVWLHGLAGRLAATGETPITAVDVSAALPDAIAAVRVGAIPRGGV